MTGILDDMGLADKPQILVVNKIDLLRADQLKSGTQTVGQPDLASLPRLDPGSPESHAGRPRRRRRPRGVRVRADRRGRGPSAVRDRRRAEPLGSGGSRVSASGGPRDGVGETEGGRRRGHGAMFAL